jgi:hypothetical protein
MFSHKTHYSTEVKTRRALVFVAFVLASHVVLLKYTCHKKFHLSDSIQFFAVDFKPKHDYLVFLHIQGTESDQLEAKLLDNLLVGGYQSWIRACHSNSSKYTCTRNGDKGKSWYLSSSLIRNKLHFDSFPHLNEIKEVMQSDQAYQVNYLTVLRDPVKRFLTEWVRFKHGEANLGANNCLSNYAKKCEYIYKGNATLDEFLMCSANLASNRQTRMLASIDPSLCAYLKRSGNTMAKKIEDVKLLESAKHTLNYMSYFALAEEPYYSMKLFEKSYSPAFLFKEINKEPVVDASIDLLYDSLSERQLRKIKEANYLDIELYQHASKLFVNKLKYYELF